MWGSQEALLLEDVQSAKHFYKKYVNRVELFQEKREFDWELYMEALKKANPTDSPFFDKREFYNAWLFDYTFGDLIE